MTISNSPTLKVQLLSVDSIYWKHSRIVGREKIEPSLEDQGYKETSKCPANFCSPDLTKLNDGMLLQDLSNVMARMDDSQLRLTSYIMASAVALRKATGYTPFQRVYINMSTPKTDYASDWYRAYILMIGDKIENDQYVYVSGDFTMTRTFLVPLSSIFDEETFLLHQQKRMRKGSIYNPKSIKSMYTKPTKEVDNIFKAEIIAKDLSRHYLEDDSPIEDEKPQKRKGGVKPKQYSDRVTKIEIGRGK